MGIYYVVCNTDLDFMLHKLSLSVKNLEFIYTPSYVTLYTLMFVSEVACL
jgi:hypothetical protein